jgi:hypothetical protein
MQDDAGTPGGDACGEPTLLHHMRGKYIGNVYE